MCVGFDVSVLVVGYLMVIGVVMDIYLVVAVVNCMFVLEKKNSYLILSYLILATLFTLENLFNPLKVVNVH